MDPGPVNVLVKINKRNRENDETFISFISRPCDLKFGMRVVDILFYFMKPADYTDYTYFLIFKSFEASW